MFTKGKSGTGKAVKGLVGMVGWAFCLGAVALLSGCAGAPEVLQSQGSLVYPSPPDEPKFVYERTLRGSPDVEGDRSSDLSLQAMLAGEDQVQGRGMSKPYGVIAAKGRVYVGDTARRVVMMFDPAKRRVKEIGGEDAGTLAKPMGMAVDDQLNLYVADTSRKEVMVFDREGKFVRSIGKREEFDHPTDVKVTRDGSRVFVVDTGSVKGKPEFHRIRVYEGASGKHLLNIGSRGSGEGQFNLLRGATIGSDNNLYVIDGGNFRVQVFSLDGRFLRSFGKVGTQLGQFARPKGIAVDGGNNLYVSDASHGNFQIFSPDGQLLLFIGSRGKADEPASYLLPAMISVDEDGRVYMVDQGYQKVDIFRPAELKVEDGALGKAFQVMKSGGAAPADPVVPNPKGGKSEAAGTTEKPAAATSEPPKADAGKADVPKANAGKADASQGEAPKADTPKSQ